MKTVFPIEAAPKSEADGATIRKLVAEAVDGLGELVADHIRLARIELATDLRIYAGATGGIVVAAWLLTVGCLLAAVAGALALARFVGMPAAFGAVAAFHLLVAGLCVRAASGEVRRTKALRETIAEARRSARTLAHPPERSAA